MAPIWSLCDWPFHRLLTNQACWLTVGACAVQGSRPLPPQVHLLTLKRLPDSKLLLRLAHLYQSGEEGSGEHGAICGRRFRIRVASWTGRDVVMLRMAVFVLEGMLGCNPRLYECSDADSTGN